MLGLIRSRGAYALLSAIMFLTAAPAFADQVRTYDTKADYDDVRFDLENAIIDRGLVIDSRGDIAGMLQRTGDDIGDDTPIYKAAEYFTFCSAKLSRRTMQADAMNIGYCPYVMFLYERIAEPGVVVVGYRRLQPAGDAESKAALAEVEALLDSIAKEASQ